MSPKVSLGQAANEAVSVGLAVKAEIDALNALGRAVESNFLDPLESGTLD